jgi:hypothetical protein
MVAVPHGGAYLSADPIGGQMNWLYVLKAKLEEISGLTRPELHVAIGCILFLVLLIILRRPLLSVLLLALVEGLNEANDFFLASAFNGSISSWAEFSPQLFWHDVLLDVVLTLTIPVVITVALRYCPGRDLLRKLRGDSASG